MAALAETIAVTAEAPLVPLTSSAVGEVVDIARIETLPLNGRQFANLTAMVPDVGLGFHSDLTKSTQYSPQISGGNGRNINYVVAGGDNNDDTVGGLLQLFPLEAVQEFNVLTHGFDAEYGRGGAVLNVVTKSGTNQLRGSWFTLLRDAALNTQTVSEKINNLEKQDYRRYQFGGSVGGPIVESRGHFFAAHERTQQDTRQVVNMLGLFSAEDGIYDVPFRENPFHGRACRRGPLQVVVWQRLLVFSARLAALDSTNSRHRSSTALASARQTLRSFLVVISIGCFRRATL